MPTVERFNGIKINVYNGDHRPPHIHALYGEHEVLLEIETAEIYAGGLPKKQLRMVREWLSQNTAWLLSLFFELNPHLQ